MSKVAKYSPRGIVVKAATAEITNCGFGVSRNMLISSFNRNDSAKSVTAKSEGKRKKKRKDWGARYYYKTNGHISHQRGRRAP